MAERNRTELSEDFARGGMPVDRFGSRFEHAEPRDPASWAAQVLGEAERQEYTPLGQIMEIWLYDRDLSFPHRSGPLLGVNREKKLLISTPVYTLPARKVLVDRKKRPIWNVEKLEEGKRAQVLAQAHIEEIRLKVEHYASGTYGQFYVLQPLTQIMIETADASKRKVYVNFLPGAEATNAVLLYDPRSGQLTIYGGGPYTFA